MSYELDEILPLSKGGDPTDYRNVQPTHRICNQRKGNKIINPNSPKKTGLPTSRDWGI